jgi:hydroxymethylbilane synthase
MSDKGSREILVGTRGSELAMAQTGAVVALLSEKWPGHTFTIRTVTTSGDRFSDAPAFDIGTGIFTKEIERGLLNRTLDIAVHSLKDLPTAQPEGLAVAAVLPREDPRDALVSKNGAKLAELPEGARIGTGSVRRAAQLLAFRSDLEIVSMRGNVPTRLKKLESMNLDAIVLAAAGLRRLELQDSITEILDPDVMLPAAGQGIVAIEARSRDADIIEIVRALEDDNARVEALAERQLLDLLGGGCQAPVGTLARVEKDAIELRGAVVSPDGSHVLKAQAEGGVKDWRDVTWKVAQELKNGGAQEILKAARRGGR